MDVSLLQAMMQDPQGTRAQLEQWIAERAATDPRMAMFLQLAQQPPPPPRSSRVERVRARISEMRDELRVLRERNQQLAAAVGACSQCFGDDAECETCGGDGSPGWLAPDPLQFTVLVAPAVARLADAELAQDDGEQT